LEIYIEIYFDFWSSKSSIISICQRALKQHEQHDIHFVILAGVDIPLKNGVKEIIYMSVKYLEYLLL